MENDCRQWPMLCAFGILAACLFVNTEMEDSRSDLAFEHPRLNNNFIFGIRCCINLVAELAIHNRCHYFHFFQEYA